MPIYDYVCASCRQKTEVIHGIDAPGPRFCPACGAEGTLRKALTTPAVHFKGSGWAKKDRSTSSSGRTRAGAASDASGDGATKAAENATASSTGGDGGTGSGNGSGAGGERGGGGSRGKDKTTTKGGTTPPRSDEG